MKKTVKFVQLYFDAGGEQNDIIKYTKTVEELTSKGYKFVKGGNSCDFYYVGGGFEIDPNCDVLIFSDNPNIYNSFIKMMNNASVVDCQGNTVQKTDCPSEASAVFNNSTSYPKKFKEKNPFLIKKHSHKTYTDSYEVEFDPSGKVIREFSLDQMV